MADYRFRAGPNESLILQVRAAPPGYSPTTGIRLPREWRDAKIEDVTANPPLKSGGASSSGSGYVMTLSNGNSDDD